MHGTEILGGLWGFASHLNRNLATHLFNTMKNKINAEKYNSNFLNPKGSDQHFLRDLFWQYARDNATIHDSYLCKSYKGTPFPTQRDINFSFLGDPYCGFSSQKPFNVTCPVECRPKDHQD